MLLDRRDNPIAFYDEDRKAVFFYHHFNVKAGEKHIEVTSDPGDAQRYHYHEDVKAIDPETRDKLKKRIQEINPAGLKNIKEKIQEFEEQGRKDKIEAERKVEAQLAENRARDYNNRLTTQFAARFEDEDEDAAGEEKSKTPELQGEKERENRKREGPEMKSAKKQSRNIRKKITPVDNDEGIDKSNKNDEKSGEKKPKGLGEKGAN